MGIVKANDAARVFIDGESVVNAWDKDKKTGKRGHGSATIELDAGIHHLRVEYFESLGSADIKFAASFDESIPGPLSAEILRYPGDDLDEAITTDGGAAAALAFPLRDLRAAGTMTGTLDGEDVVAFWVPGSSSALDSATVSGGVDVGATGVFVPVVDGRALTFEWTDGVITDAETGSTWDVFGTATDGELAGSSLEQLTHIDTFWFAWIAFHPDSELGAAPPGSSEPSE